MLFRFYCDESYDGNSLCPDALTISGFFSDEETWAEIEMQWVTSIRDILYGVFTQPL